MRSVSHPLGWTLAVVLVSGSFAVASVAAPARRGPPPARRTAPPSVSNAATTSPVLQLNTGRGRLVELPSPMTDVFVSDEKIADVQVRSPTQLYVFGKSGGETTLSVTNRAGQVIYGATVRVGNNFNSIQQMLSLAMPDAHIVATPMNGLVLLTGTVAAPDDGAEATRLVQAFVGDSTKVLSRLGTATPLQVNLQVRIAEVSRSFVKNIGVNLTNRAIGGGALFNITQGRQGTITGGGTTGSPTTYNFPPATGVGTSLGLAGHALGMDLLTSLDLGERDGQVSTLANPNMTVISGETGSFLAGGEFPIPAAQGNNGAISIEFKQYGVSLSYTPTVLADGRISLHVRPEVSQISSSGSVTLSGVSIPALTTRRAETTIELGSGQSMMIAGLLQNNHNNSIDKAPGLGDVPVVGALFRSNAFQRNETELVIVITPYLVKPVNGNDIALPTDGYKAPTDLGRVFMGELGSGTNGGARPTPTMAPLDPAQPSFGAMAPLPIMPPPSAPGDQRRDAPASALPPASAPKKGATAAPGFSIN